MKINGLVLKFYTDRTLLEAYERILSRNNATDHISCLLPLINIIMLTVSPTTAECERDFSLINCLKTHNGTVSLMRIKIDGPEFEHFNSTDGLREWLECGNRHIHDPRLSGPRAIFRGPRSR